MTRRVPTLAVLAVVLAAGCGAATTERPDPLPPPVTAPASTPATAPERPSWAMPDLVGSNLQEAQDAIQELTDFEIALTTSFDATGEGRQQVLDRNWRVCTQNVPPGSPIAADSLIEFGAVKLDEPC